MEWNFKNEFTILFHRSAFIGIVWTCRIVWLFFCPSENLHGNRGVSLPHQIIMMWPFLPLLSRQEEVARLAALQPQVDLLEKQLKELKEAKEGEEDPSAFLDADINAFKEHYHKVLEDLRARERQLHLGERGEMLIHCKNLIPATHLVQSIWVDLFISPCDPCFC